MQKFFANRSFLIGVSLGLLAVFALVGMKACSTEEKPNKNDDPNKIANISNCAAKCGDIVEAVCDVNGKVYLNRCVADCAGAVIDDSRECSPCRFELDEYKAQGLQKVKLLDEYISLILNKEVNNSQPENVAVTQAIDEAVELFVNEDAQVAVSGTRTNYYAIRDYLERIRSYSYGRVDIKWSEIGYITDLEKGADGNYYASVTITQVFRGYDVEGVNPIYVDVTTKTVNVVLKTYSLSRDGEIDLQCEVYLSDIGVKDWRREEI
jgi:hypothetical protein